MSQNQSAGQISPDGNYEWNGTQWIPRNAGPTPPPSPGYPAQPPPPKQKHTLRNVLLIILALVVLAIGGCVALVGSAANEVDKAIKKSDAADKEPGGPDNPLTIRPGKAFEVQGFKYAAGWQISPDGIGGMTIKKLKFTNNRDKKDSAIVEIKFMKGSEILGTADCISQPVPVGQTATVSCAGTDGSVKGYKRITINDTF
jgi:hypothetical protein